LLLAQSSGVQLAVYLDMELMYLLPFARAQSPHWQKLLCQSVRLYLAMGEPGVAPTEAEAGLRSVEGQLVWHLLLGRKLTPPAEAEEWAIVEASQPQLLDGPDELAECLAWLSATQSPELGQAPDRD
jgi:hypothetical protein